ncbi:hypothetical protein, partial [Anaerofustis stercorihominis]
GKIMISKKKVHMLLFTVMALFILISVPSISKAADDEHFIFLTSEDLSVTYRTDKTKGVKGEEVILTVTPYPGYKIKDLDTRLTIVDSENNSIPFTKTSGPDSNLEEKFKFIIGDHNITVTVPHSDPCYDLTVDPNIKFGKVTLTESKLCL